MFCLFKLYIFVLCIAHYCISFKFTVRAWFQVSFLHGLCKNSLSTVCPAWPVTPAGQGWEIDSDQTGEEDDPGEYMVCKKMQFSLI